MKGSINKGCGISSKYPNTTAGVFMAHVHSNELRHHPKFSPDAPPLLISGSITPCYTTDPTFVVVCINSRGL